MKQLILLFALLALVVAFSPGQVLYTSNYAAWCMENGHQWDGTNDTCTIRQGSNESVGQVELLNIEGILNNHGTISNYGRLIVRGSVNNYGVISNNGDETPGKYGDGEIWNWGVISNYNTITNTGVILNPGIIRNYDTIAISDIGPPDESHGYVRNTNIIVNYHNINNGSRIENQAKILNVGTINNHDELINFGSVDGSIFYNLGIINNFATIINQRRFFSDFDLWLNGIIYNLGVINNFDTFENQYKIYNSLCSNSIINEISPTTGDGVIIELDQCGYLPLVARK